MLRQRELINWSTPREVSPGRGYGDAAPAGSSSLVGKLDSHQKMTYNVIDFSLLKSRRNITHIFLGDKGASLPVTICLLYVLDASGRCSGKRENV